VWDYSSKNCIQTLEGHSDNVTICAFHPKIPVIITGSEDHTITVWNSSTYKFEQNLSFGLERVWAIAYTENDTKVGFGFDYGTVVIKLGKEEPVVSMDSKGRVILAVHNDIKQLTIKKSEEIITDGEKSEVQTKELNTTEMYPQSLKVTPKK
jgi:coatomer subunit beta'